MWRACIAVVVVLSVCGCTMGRGTAEGQLLRTERGRLLRTEQRALYEDASCHLVDSISVHMGYPYLSLTVVADGLVDEVCRVYQEVEVYRVEGWAFQPRFFLWPVNLVRTPLGLLGWTSSGVAAGGHYAAMTAGIAVIGVVGLIVELPARALGSHIGDVMGISLPLGMLATGLLEVGLLVVDIPHGLVHGTPLFPVVRGSDRFPGAWWAAARRSWEFAWDYQAYPALPVLPATERRRAVPGGELSGDWTVDEGSRRSAFVDVGEFRLIGDGWVETVPAPEGRGMVGLLPLAERRSDGDVLRFRVEADIPGRAISRGFEYSVAYLHRLSAERSAAEAEL
jgi:hypothetical protein